MNEILNVLKEETEHLDGNELLSFNVSFVKNIIELIEQYEKALKEIAEETGTPYSEIARKALK